MNSCPGDETVSSYLAGELDPTEHTDVDAHLETCGECRALIAGLARGQVVDRSDDDGGDPMRGLVLGRYTLIELLGAGGMGLVYRAHDPVLARDVAVKLIHALDIRPADRERMLREARAMARLAHPNVLTIFDAGESGGELFIAMALVDGTTLRQHCTRTRPGWRAVVGLCLAAARGLAASHRAGVLHRDIKPDNILVGRDGAVQVTDFGLARATGEPGAPSWTTSSRESEQAGTPAYLAPELRAGGEPTIASDQYSFCLTLKECLGRVPRRLAPILRRGLAVDPQRRYPSMDALVAALAAATRPRWPIVAAVVATGALVPLILLGPLGARDQPVAPAAPDACDQPQTRMDGLWNPAQRQRLRAAITGLELPRGELLLTRLAARLDEHARRWIDLRSELCRDPGSDGEAQAIAARRIACLEEGFTELERYLAVLHDPDPAMIGELEWLSYGLTPPDRCSASAPIMLLPSPDPAVREEVARAHEALREASTLAAAPADALAAVRAIEATARRVAYLPLQAAALSKEAELLMATGDFAGARARLETAAELAEACGDDTRRALVLLNLVGLVSIGAGDPDAGLAYAARARPLVERLGMPILAGELSRAEGQALLHKGDITGARDHLERALAVWDSALVGDHDTIVSTLMYLGATTQQLGAWQAAEDYQRRAHEMSVRLHGERHPAAAAALKDWAIGVLNHAEAVTPPAERDRLARLAIARAEQAAATLAAVGLADHPESAQTQSIVCRAHYVQDELELAAPACTRALAASRRAYGEASPHLRTPLHLLGVVQHARGALAPAHAAFTEALALPVAGDPALRAELQFSLAKLLRDQGRDKQALALAREARPVFAADPRTATYLAELDAWLAARPR